jgi:hypothetical protein
LPSCFSAIGILRFSSPGSQEALATLDAGDVKFATQIEVHNAAQAEVRFDLDLIQDGRVVARATCDPLDRPGIRACSYIFRDLDGRWNDFACHYVMKCAAHLDKGGPTLLRARLSAPVEPEGFSLEHANLVIGH